MRSVDESEIREPFAYCHQHPIVYLRSDRVKDYYAIFDTGAVEVIGIAEIIHADFFRSDDKVAFVVAEAANVLSGGKIALQKDNERVVGDALGYS